MSSYAALQDYSGGTAASTSFVMCRNSTRAGVFSIAARISSDDGDGNVKTYEMTPATFTMVAPTSKRAARILAKKAAAKKAAAKKKAEQRRRHHRHHHRG